MRAADVCSNMRQDTEKHRQYLPFKKLRDIFCPQMKNPRKVRTFWGFRSGTEVELN